MATEIVKEQIPVIEGFKKYLQENIQYSYPSEWNFSGTVFEHDNHWSLTVLCSNKRGILPHVKFKIDEALKIFPGVRYAHTQHEAGVFSKAVYYTISVSINKPPEKDN